MVVVVMAKLDAKVEDVYRAEFNANENSRLIAVSIAVFVVVFVYKDFIPVFLAAETPLFL